MITCSRDGFLPTLVTGRRINATSQGLPGGLFLSNREAAMDVFMDWFGYFLIAQALIELGVLALIFEFA